MKKIVEDIKYKQLLATNATAINDLSSKVNEYRKLNISDLSEEEYGKRVHAVSKCLHEFLELFTQYGKFKDTFVNPTYFINYEGLQVHITSKKTGHKFDFGFDYNGIYLQSYISHPENLKNMQDEFWDLLLKLGLYGDFKFVENAGFESHIKRKYTHLFKPMKSNVYRLMRNYLMQELLYIDSMDNTISDLGWFSVRWSPEDYSVDEILVLGCESFKIMYQLSYSLWKVSDLREYYDAKKNGEANENTKSNTKK